MKEDAALVATVLANGMEAFGLIVERYKKVVFGVALARVRNFHDAEDITQAAFLEAFERLEHLMRVDVSDERKRKEFIPLAAEMLQDRSKKVRRIASSPWILGPCAVDLPLEKVAAALKRETDPRARQLMQLLLIKIIESRRPENPDP